MATAGYLCFSGEMGGGIRGVKIGTQQHPLPLPSLSDALPFLLRNHLFTNNIVSYF